MTIFGTADAGTSGAAQDVQHHPRNRDLRTSAIAIRDAHTKALRAERLTARQGNVRFPAFHSYAAIADDRRVPRDDASQRR